MRIASHAGLHYHLKHLRRRHPDVDILLIEPRADDVDLLNAPLMDFGARQALLEHGCRAVRQHLSDNYAHFAAVLSRHGLRLRPPSGQDHAERLSAASPGSTHAQRAAAEPVTWPSRSRPGPTGAPAASTSGRPPRWRPALESAPVSAQGESRNP
jgi:hypothetical protein